MRHYFAPDSLKHKKTLLLLLLRVPDVTFAVAEPAAGRHLLLREELHAFATPCRSPKNDSSQPLNGNHAMEAGTPMLMPIMPALARCLNSRAALPLRA